MISTHASFLNRMVSRQQHFCVDLMILCCNAMVGVRFSGVSDGALLLSGMGFPKADFAVAVQLCRVFAHNNQLMCRSGSALAMVCV